MTERKQVIMDPPDLARLVVLQQELRIQIKQLELYPFHPSFGPISFFYY